MSRTRYRIFANENEYPYFMTCTIVAWLPVFTRPEASQIILDSWKYLAKEKHFKLFAYVILENHLHLIASAPKLSTAMQSFKGYTAHRLLELLEESGAKTLLDQFRYFKKRHKTETTYQLWEEGNHPKQIRTDETMWQKVEYIQMNPVKRGYVDDPLHWRYSSARNYAGQEGLIDVVTDWK